MKTLKMYIYKDIQAMNEDLLFQISRNNDNSNFHPINYVIYTGDQPDT